MEVRLQRFWIWVKDFCTPANVYRFFRTSAKRYRSGRIAISVRQQVYRRRQFFKKEYWHGVVHVSIQVVGVRLVFKLEDAGSVKGKVLYATEEYALRRNGDYVHLLRHLAFMRDMCDLTELEEELLLDFKEKVMTMWPPRSNLDIQVCIHGTQNHRDGIS